MFLRSFTTGKTRMAALTLTLALGAGLLAGPLAGEAAAGLTPKGQTSKADAMNPESDAADIILPMPGGVTMAFRAVAVDANGFLWDKTVRPGTSDAADSRGFYDGRYTTGISAPFSAADVPASWKKGTPPDSKFFYLIAKYEVTRLQWRAVMDENADTKTPKPDDALPVTDITWFDAVNFTQRWTDWLLKNSPDALPSFKGDSRNTAFVRLPTEVEWEYAARGGQNVPSQTFRDDFFPMADGTQIRDYAVYQVEKTSHGAENIAKVGSRRPNPLGLYDTAGNAAEMTIDMFRFSVGGRLLGSAGGFVRKGGSFLSGVEEITPGRREEIPFFQKNGAFKSRDLGFRPVISGINTPGGSRPSELLAEYKKAGTTDTQSAPQSGQRVTPAAASTPEAELDRLIADAQNEGIRKNLLALKSSIKERSIIQERGRQAEIIARLTSCVSYLESLRNYNFRLNMVAYLEQQIKNNTTMGEKERERLAKTQHHTLETVQETSKKTLASYRATLEDIADAPDDLVDRSLKSLASDYGKGKDMFSRRSLNNLMIIREHCSLLRQHRKLTDSDIQADIKKSDKLLD